MSENVSRDALTELMQLVDEQAEDESLWFVAETAPEKHLQAALRLLHHAVETRVAAMLTRAAPAEPSAAAEPRAEDEKTRFSDRKMFTPRDMDAQTKPLHVKIEQLQAELAELREEF